MFDSADAFVFLAGISVVLAYGSRKLEFSEVVGKLWKRAGHLYKINLVVVAVSALVLCVGPILLYTPTLENNPLRLAGDHGITSYLWHIITFQQSVGYSMILRLYVLLMLVAPFYLWLAARRFWYPLIVAVPLWVAGGAFGIVESDALTGTPLRLTFLPWNLTFAMGIALGAAMNKRVELPRSRGMEVFAICVAVVLPVALLSASKLSPLVLDWLNHRDDQFLLGASKTFQSPLRVISLICAAYLVLRFSEAPIIRLLHEVNASNVLCRLGRNSLRVFAVGAVLSQAVEQVLVTGHFRFGISFGSFPSIVIESLLVICSFLAMAWVAGHEIRRTDRLQGLAIGT